jgi:NADH-quinone oxidoreductase subunit J
VVRARLQPGRGLTAVVGVLGSVSVLAAAASKVDIGVFAVCAVVIVAGALGVVFARHPVHSALSLVATLLGVAVLFVAQEAHFLAAVQVIVYAGAIVVLFLFVIMLVGVDREERLDVEPLRGQRVAGGALGLALLFLVIALFQLGSSWATGEQSVRGPTSVTDGPATERVENVEQLGRSLFTDFLLPFEITGVLLVIAVVGAVVLARRLSRAELAELRASEAEGAEVAGAGEPAGAAAAGATDEAAR